jgi:hypothetical protein
MKIFLSIKTAAFLLSSIFVIALTPSAHGEANGSEDAKGTQFEDVFAYAKDLFGDHGLLFRAFVSGDSLSTSRRDFVKTYGGTLTSRPGLSRPSLIFDKFGEYCRSINGYYLAQRDQQNYRSCLKNAESDSEEIIFSAYVREDSGSRPSFVVFVFVPTGQVMDKYFKFVHYTPWSVRKAEADKLAMQKQMQMEWKEQEKAANEREQSDRMAQLNSLDGESKLVKLSCSGETVVFNERHFMESYSLEFSEESRLLHVKKDSKYSEEDYFLSAPQFSQSLITGLLTNAKGISPYYLELNRITGTLVLRTDTMIGNNFRGTCSKVSSRAF